MALLLLSLAALLVGPVVERLVRRAAWTEAMLDGFVLTALVGLILIHVLPHNVEVAGLWAFVAAGLGFLVPLLLEGRLHQHGDGARGLHRWLLVAGFLGYAIHASLDGLALATGHDDHGNAGELLGVAVVLHRIPVGLAIWWLLRPAVGPLGTLAIIGTIAASTIAGYSASAWLLDGLERPAVGLLQALVAGSLLHVALHPGGNRQGGSAQARASAIGGILAIAALFGVATVHPMARRFAEEVGSGAAFRAFYLQAAPALLLGLVGSAAWTTWRRRPAMSTSFAFLDGIAECSCQGLPRYRVLLQGKNAVRAHTFLIASTELGLIGLIPSLVLLGLELTLARLLGTVLLLLVLGLGLGRSAKSAPTGPAVEVHTAGSFTDALLARIDHTVPWILLGLGTAAFLEPLLSGNALEATAVGGAIALWGALGLPIYLCSAAATPIAAVLIHKGLPPGAAIALLLAGPAVSLAGLTELAKVHSRKHAALYGLGVYLVAVGTGWGVDLVLGHSSHFDLHAEAVGSADLYSVAAGVVLAGLMVVSLVRQGVRGFAGQILGLRAHDHSDHHEDHHHGHHHPEGLPDHPKAPAATGGFRFHGRARWAKGPRAPLYLGLRER